jgi:hypothetical protein
LVNRAEFGLIKRRRNKDKKMATESKTKEKQAKVYNNWTDDRKLVVAEFASKYEASSANPRKYLVLLMTSSATPSKKTLEFSI